MYVALLWCWQSAVSPNSYPTNVGRSGLSPPGFSLCRWISVLSIIFEVVWIKMKEIVSLRHWCPHSTLCFPTDMPLLWCFLFSFLISVVPLFHFVWHRCWQMAFFRLTIFVCVCPESCLILRMCIFHTVLKRLWQINSFLLPL
jgi:hypothetical protein